MGKRLLFVGITGLLAVVLGIALSKDAHREWTVYQTRLKRTLEPAERREIAWRIHQTIATPLNRIDRCTTCHLAVENPKLALAEQPFTAHPGRWMEWHPVEKFGCTVCHGGQGLATETRAAHGEVKHWEEPLRRGPLIQAACAQCHGNVAAIAEHVPLIVEGRQLFTQHGCVACHVLHGEGQSLSVDLTEIADKPLQELDFTFVEGPQTLAQWFYEHFKDPQKITPGFRKAELPPGEEAILPSAMPNYGLTDAEALALTVYMLSLHGEDFPASYVTPRPPEPEPAYATSVERGRALFTQYGCVACHGMNGTGGRKNWNALSGEEVPPLTFVGRGFTRETLKEKIHNGVPTIARLDPSRPSPSLYMPAWGEKLSNEEIDALVDYLLSLAPPGASRVEPATF